MIIKADVYYYWGYFSLYTHCLEDMKHVISAGPLLNPPNRARIHFPKIISYNFGVHIIFYLFLI